MKDAGKIEPNWKAEESIENLWKRTDEISDETKRVREQANLILLLGATSALVGILTLLYGFGIPKLGAFPKSPPASIVCTAEELGSLVLSYLPLISVAGLIEGFAFFFLRLYRSSISDLRYLQNEITNLRCWASALNLSTEQS